MNGLLHGLSFAVNAIDLAMTWHDPVSGFRKGMKVFKMAATFAHGAMATTNAVAYCMTLEEIAKLRVQLKEVQNIQRKMEENKERIGEIQRWIQDRYDDFDDYDRVAISKFEMAHFDLPVPESDDDQPVEQQSQVGATQ